MFRATGSLLNRERIRIGGELRQVSGLMPLLMKRRNGQQWTREDRTQVRSHLYRLYGISPYLVVFALPDMDAAANRYALEIPYMSSVLLKHDPDGVVLGLDQVAAEERPHVPTVFFAFRLMVGIGFFLFADDSRHKKYI